MAAEQRWLQLSEHRISFTRWPCTQNLLISLNTQPAPHSRLSGLCLLPPRVAMAAAGPPRGLRAGGAAVEGGGPGWCVAAPCFGADPRLCSAAVARPPLAAGKKTFPHYYINKSPGRRHVFNHLPSSRSGVQCRVRRLPYKSRWMGCVSAVNPSSESCGSLLVLTGRQSAFGPLYWWYNQKQNLFSW